MSLLVDLRHGDALDVLRSLPDKSVDAVITDPPYGIGLAEWDRPPNLAALHHEIRRVGREFYAVFGQLPSLFEWHAAASGVGMHFCEHISWVKRISTPLHRLKRGHESILIYALGRRRQFFVTSGPYEDVKVPGVALDTIAIEGIQRHIADLHRKLAGGSALTCQRAGGNEVLRRKFNSDHKTDRSPHLTNFTNVWSFLPPTCSRRAGRHDGHPTAKPLLVMQRLVEMLTPEAGIVLDCFFGGGTTGEAAVRTGRSVIGVERDAVYFELAQRRLADVLNTLPAQAIAAD